MTAEGEKQSRILVAEGHKESKILEAEAEKQAAILHAEAVKEAKIREAEVRLRPLRRCKRPPQTPFACSMRPTPVTR